MKHVDVLERCLSVSDDHESEEHEEHEQDNGMEADQHIHVQLKKAADSDQKPFHVTFKNGKKHPVSHEYGKDYSKCNG